MDREDENEDESSNDSPSELGTLKGMKPTAAQRHQVGARRAALKPWHVTALQLALAGLTKSEIARQLKKNARTIQRLWDSDWMNREMIAFQRAVMEKTAKDRVDPICRFQQLIGRAIDKLEEKLMCGDHKTEYLAACRLLDNAGFSPIKKVQVSEDEALRGLTLDEMKYVARTGRLPASKSLLEVTNGEETDSANSEEGSDEEDQ